MRGFVFAVGVDLYQLQRALGDPKLSLHSASSVSPVTSVPLQALSGTSNLLNCMQAVEADDRGSHHYAKPEALWVLPNILESSSS